MKHSFWVLGIGLLLSACSSMLMSGSASQSGSLPEARQRSAQQLNEDRLITAQVISSYSKDPTLKSAGIGVATHTGTVTLTGTVASFEIRDRAVSIARNTQNVRTVNNQMIVNSNH